MKENFQNARVIRRYRIYMEQAKRYSEDTMRSHERAIEIWETYTSGRDLVRITAKSAGQFSAWLKERLRNGEVLSAASQYQIVRFVKTFYLWLATQPGRHSKSIITALGYLTVDRETVAEATSPGRRKVPSLDYVMALFSSIEPIDDIARRDRALIAFLLLSGTRASAAATLSMACFDRDRLIVYQDPRLGVLTKNRKYIRTKLVPLNSALLGGFLNWFDFLRKDKLYGDADPIFPRSRTARPDGGLSFEAAGIEPMFWADGTRIDHIIKARAAAAGLEQYDCHAFRHMHVKIAFAKGCTGEELKAISQNIGHKYFGTTASVYGHLDEEDVARIIDSIDFTTDPKKTLSPAKLKMFKQFLQDLDLTDDDT